MHSRITLLVAAICTLSGCTMIPDYRRPDSPVPDVFTKATTTQPAPASTQSADVDAIRWREVFIDDRLRRCIELALANNRDLRIAALNVERAQAEYRIERASLYPELDGSGSYTRARAGATRTGGVSTSAYTYNQYDVGLGVTSYELDLFGRVRSATRQQLELYFAREEARRGTQISLVAQVASQYLTLRQYEQQLNLARQTLESVQNGYSVTVSKVEVGTAPESDTASADVQVQTAKVDIHNYQRLVAQANNRLQELIGHTVPDDEPSADALLDEKLLADLPAGLPSGLIARRPDILSAEHELLAANANIGAARAAFFPSIALTGSAGFSSGQLSTLFNSSSGVWSFGPQVSIPIFDGGRNQATLDVAGIDKRLEIATYEKTIQTAFREVSDALVARDTYTNQVKAQQDLVGAQERRFGLAQSRYDNGIENYLNVLTAQQDLYSAQQNLITSRAVQLQNLVTLYKALGGGWDASDAELALQGS